MKNNWQERAAKLDFDPQNAAQRRVWARVNAPTKPYGLKRPLAWAACAVLVMGLGGILLSHSSLVFRPAAQLSEEDCAQLNSRYLLARALARSEDNCPCDKHWASYDRQTVLQLRKELKTVAGAVCSPREQEKLKQCNAKYRPQLKTISLCKTLC